MCDGLRSFPPLFLIQNNQPRIPFLPFLMPPPCHCSNARSAPKRLSCSPLSIAGPSAGRVELNGNGCGSEHENGGADDRPPPTKRPRTEEGSSAAASTRQNEGADRKQRPIFDEVEYLADRFENTIDQL
uniref:Uncharacterized protein n=1 Tax=Odontella aurita TaxID=265563 RepID=A0A7S4IX09_9STRA